MKTLAKRFTLVCILAMFILGSISSENFVEVLPVKAQDSNDNVYLSLLSHNQAQTAEQTVYLPIAMRGSPWFNVFGVESTVKMLAGSPLLQKMQQLGNGWARVATFRVSWADLQPNEGDPIDWTKLAELDSELRALKDIQVKPVVLVQTSPRWATVIPSTCGPIRADKFNAFASFMTELVERYKKPEFNVHDWEIGNEIDVDPALVAVDNGFGCWGDIADPNYGGAHYGEMLKVITPAMRAEDPWVRVWIGGLLLNSPESAVGQGRPEWFLKGILAAGAADYFDVVPYHSYPSYLNRNVDHELEALPAWKSWGGALVGKARFLRSLMLEYGVSKSIVLNEGGLGCYENTNYCPPNTAEVPAGFYDAQANFLARGYVRLLNQKVDGVLWYTFNGPAWRYTGLLNGSTPTLTFYAYQHLIKRLESYQTVTPVDYGIGLEAYRFLVENQFVDVVFALQDQQSTVAIPQSKFVAAYTRDGAVISPASSSTNYLVDVGFTPVYILRKP